MTDPFEDAATMLEQSTKELEVKRQHLRVAAQHYRDHEVPRACAHVWSATGHLKTAGRLLDDLAIVHASKSYP
jgi:hypothetical protein